MRYINKEGLYTRLNLQNGPGHAVRSRNALGGLAVYHEPPQPLYNQPTQFTEGEADELNGWSMFAGCHELLRKESHMGLSLLAIGLSCAERHFSVFWQYKEYIRKENARKFMMGTYVNLPIWNNRGNTYRSRADILYQLQLCASPLWPRGYKLWENGHIAIYDPSHAENSRQDYVRPADIDSGAQAVYTYDPMTNFPHIRSDGGCDTGDGLAAVLRDYKTALLGYLVYGARDEYLNDWIINSWNWRVRGNKANFTKRQYGDELFIWDFRESLMFNFR